MKEVNIIPKDTVIKYSGNPAWFSYDLEAFFFDPPLPSF